MDWKNFVNNDSHLVIKIAKKITPLLFAAALLPAFFVLLMKPPSLNFSPQASQTSELDLWLEPSTVITNIDKDVELTVFARVEDSSIIIPSLTVRLLPDTSLLLDKSELSTSESFSGKTILGKVRVKATQSGEFKLFIPEDGVSVDMVTKAIVVRSAPAKIIVR